MSGSIHSFIQRAREAREPLLAVLHDPDKVDVSRLPDWLYHLEEHGVDLVLVGGSLLTTEQFDEVVQSIRANTSLPVVLFPGGPQQIHSETDAILLLSLISGRNPELLIGKHVEAAQALKESQLEILPTGYMLIDGGKITTASYVSNTLPLPADKPELAATTALAGTQLGLKHIYMDAGSGALKPISSQVIRAVRNEVDVPIWVGGGIRTPQDVKCAIKAGADVVVIGTALEEDGSRLQALSQAMRLPQEPVASHP